MMATQLVSSSCITPPRGDHASRDTTESFAALSSTASTVRTVCRPSRMVTMF